MTRTNPVVWSSLFATPFVAVGVNNQFDFLAVEIPAALAQVSLAIGLGLVVSGAYVHLVAGSDWEPDEMLLQKNSPRTPFTRLQSVFGLIGLGLAGHWLFYTQVPYVYPTVATVVGALLFTTGIWTYWQNSLITYYLTEERLVTETRLLGTHREETRLEKIKKRSVARPLYLRLFGLGNLELDTGANSRTLVRHIPAAESFERELADAIRNQ